MIRTDFEPKSQGFYIQWINNDGFRQIPVLANDCHSYSDAVRWAVANDRPVWATEETCFIVHDGIPRHGVDRIVLMIRQAKRW